MFYHKCYFRLDKDLSLQNLCKKKTEKNKARIYLNDELNWVFLYDFYYNHPLLWEKPRVMFIRYFLEEKKTGAHLMKHYPYYFYD